ncbi:HAAS signaling domain-containing protein [Actinoplanes solisilvae]|uniref:HAAS signaling domain-containing protein n=1 Tax=Actinoplanes solisilvae TaxID=2486853 RepID=UPI000FD92061|nr:hypothetical protein [Actinoplanes solisilvae]
MTTAPLAHTDVIVLDYLAALWSQSEDLSPELRDELMTTVADYVAMRRTSASPLEDAAEIVNRLGPPESLVAAARRGHLPPHLRLPALVPPPPAPATITGGAAEFTAVGLMTAGSFVLPGVAPVAGMLMASASPHWTPAEKALAWFVVLGSGAAALAIGFIFALAGAGGAAVMLFCYLAAAGGGVFAGMRLLDRVRHR